MSKTAVDITPTLNYKYYKNNYENTVTLEVFIKILKLVNAKIIKLMFKGVVITLPHKLGILYVSRYKPKYRFNEDGSLDLSKSRKLINWKETNQLWLEQPELKKKKYLVYDNEHSDGYKVKIMWQSVTRKIAYKIFNFVPARQFIRDLASYIKINKKVDYNDNKLYYNQHYNRKTQ